MNSTVEVIITNIKLLVDRNMSPFQYLKSINRAQTIGVLSEFEVRQIKKEIKNYRVKP